MGYWRCFGLVGVAAELLVVVEVFEPFCVQAGQVGSLVSEVVVALD